MRNRPDPSAPSCAEEGTRRNIPGPERFLLNSSATVVVRTGPLLPVVRRSLACCALALTCLAACHRPDPVPPARRGVGYWSHSPIVCEMDEAREYFCDELLPQRSAFPAAPPYEDCPGVVDEHVGEFDPTPSVAVFDPSYTEHIRERQSPGSSCCYSWCATITLRDAGRIEPRARCDEPGAIRESYCLDEPEAGTSQPGAAPFERCPSAIAPPEAIAFFVPPGALLDPTQTGERRQRGFEECCYAWCSVVPRGGPVRGR